MNLSSRTGLARRCRSKSEVAQIGARPNSRHQSGPRKPNTPAGLGAIEIGAALHRHPVGRGGVLGHCSVDGGYRKCGRCGMRHRAATITIHTVETKRAMSRKVACTMVLAGIRQVKRGAPRTPQLPRQQRRANSEPRHAVIRHASVSGISTTSDYTMCSGESPNFRERDFSTTYSRIEIGRSTINRREGHCAAT